MNGLLSMLLKESGQLDLDEDISTYTGVAVRNPHFPDVPVTARHLLWHTSSLQDSESAVNRFGEWKTRGADCPVSLEDYVISRLVNSASASQLWSNRQGPGIPGQRRYHYSNAGAT